MKVKLENGVKDGFRFELGRQLAKLALSLGFLAVIFLGLMLLAYVSGT